MLKYFKPKEPFITEHGSQLNKLIVGYHTFGNYVKDKTPVIWVCHALTANSDVSDWWSNIYGENQVLDPTKNFIICANTLGSCYGTFFENTVNVTTRDMAKAHQLLLDHLGITKVDVLIGGSLGGQQAMEWAIQQPNKIKKLVLLATNAKHSPWGIAFNETQRMAIDLGKDGLKVARAIAMLSYRNYEVYKRTKRDSDKIWDYGAMSYQRYQGEKLAKRFDEASYRVLSLAMDAHDVSRNRESISNALRLIQAKTLVVGIKTDLLFPTEEQELLAKEIENCMLYVINSPFGHDGFLTEGEALTNIIKPFINE